MDQENVVTIWVLPAYTIGLGLIVQQNVTVARATPRCPAGELFYVAPQVARWF